MPTIKQVVEQFAENPGEIFGQLLAAVDTLHKRVELLEMQMEQLTLADADEPANWDKEETHLS